jgi:hypothetical protein
MAAPTKRRSTCSPKSAASTDPRIRRRAKDKNDPFRLMGFGHRVYKNYDPRAKIMQKTTHEVLGELGIKDDPLLEVAMELEKIALTDSYFIEKKLYPNIDFYSGITLKALGFPTTMFTVLFALARTVGWIAQWKRDDRGSEPAHRPPAPALPTDYRRGRSRGLLGDVPHGARPPDWTIHRSSDAGTPTSMRERISSKSDSTAARCNVSVANWFAWRARRSGRTCLS